MSYEDEANFDDSRLRAYARKVARARSAEPLSYFPTIGTTERRKFFRRVFDFSVVENELPGWVLLINCEEGRLSSMKVNGSRLNTRLDGFEHGRVLVLSPKGKLLVSDYESYCFEHSTLGFVDQVKGLDFYEASKSSLVGFDRLNRYTYRTSKPSSNEVWREELGVKFAPRGKKLVPGLETSLALKAFLEANSYRRVLKVNS